MITQGTPTGFPTYCIISYPTPTFQSLLHYHLHPTAHAKSRTNRQSPCRNSDRPIPWRHRMVRYIHSEPNPSPPPHPSRPGQSRVTDLPPPHHIFPITPQCSILYSIYPQFKDTLFFSLSSLFFLCYIVRVDACARFYARRN